MLTTDDVTIVTNIVTNIYRYWSFWKFLKARVGLVHFSTNVNDVFEMNQHGDIRSILSAIENIQYKERHYQWLIIKLSPDDWSKADVQR